MLEPKKLYTIKDYSWLVYPTKEAAVKAVFGGVRGVADAAARTRRARRAPRAGCTAAAAADLWSEELGCLVSFIEPNSNFMVVETDGKFVQILGDRVGWIVADMSDDWIRNCFEEIVNAQT